MAKAGESRRARRADRSAALGTRDAAAPAGRALYGRAMADARRDPRALAARRGAPETRLRRARRDRLHRGRARRGARAWHAREPDRSAARARYTDTPHPGRRDPAHHILAVAALKLLVHLLGHWPG